MITESALYAGIRIRKHVASPPFSPVRTNQHWPRDGWKGIIYQVCLERRIKIADVMSNSRKRDVVACRWEIIRQMRETTGHNGKPVSQPAIGRRLGIDHSSVNYALRRMNGEPPEVVKNSSYRYGRRRSHKRLRDGSSSAVPRIIANEQ